VLPDFFEIDRMIEELAKIYGTACATSWFKLTKNNRPTKEEFRGKVVEFMKYFEQILGYFPQSSEAEQFKEYLRKALYLEINRVLSGNNKEVERRYKYFVDYS
jgi:hypothetical protein